MRHTHNIKTVSGETVPVFTHDSAGFVWRTPAGARLNYAIPTDATWSVTRLQSMIRLQGGYPGATVETVTRDSEVRP